MRQDRRLNGWVMIGSIVEIILSMALLSAGIALAVVGFAYTDKLAVIDELQFFVNQEGIIKLQLSLFNNEILKPEFLYLALGIFAGVVGLIALILATVSLVYSQKRKVVRRRVALLIYSLIPLAIVGCATTYLVLEFDIITELTKWIEYGLYGIIGGFGFVALCLILGVIFGRSEKFMSNDNSKYSFDNTSLRNARADVNNNIRNAQYVATQQQYPNQPQQRLIPAQQNRAPQGQVRQMQGQPRQTQGQRPMPQGATRPVQPMRPMQAPQGQRPVQAMGARPGQQARPMQARPNNIARPIPQGAGRPVQMQQRPAMPQNRGAQMSGANRYCPKCGKQLLPNEQICTLCGYKINK